MYVCMCVFAITATPFNLELSNFGITFVMSISKNDFLKFLKNCFFAELLPFFYISIDFSINLKSDYVKTRGGRNQILLHINQHVEDKNSYEKKCPNVDRFFCDAYLTSRKPP